MILVRFVLPVLLTLLAQCLPAQGTTVEHRFTGLARTQEQYLLRNSGAATVPADSARLWALRQTLVNLPVVSDATFRVSVDSLYGDTTVVWTVRESRAVLPIVNFGGLRDNVNFLLGGRDANVGGRATELTAWYQNNDGEHGFLLALRNPSLFGSRWGYEFEARRYASIEPLYFPSATVDYRYANLSLTTGASYRLRPRHHLGLGTTVFRERYRRRPGQEPGPGPLARDEYKLLLRASHNLDRRDFLRERLAGWQHYTTLQSVLTRGVAEPFLLLLHEVRAFRPLGRAGNLAGRIRLGLSTNRASPFAPFVLDSQLNIRGSGNRIDRGTAQAVLNLEYRHRIWRDRRDRLAAQVVAFSDFGTWRNPGGSLSELVDPTIFRHFLGGGARLAWLRNRDVVLRIDYGVDVRDTRQRGFVLGFGQYF